MIRFISFLLGKPYEPCKSCETLKQQLAFVNEEKKQLTETLLSIVKPKTFEAPPVEVNPIVSTSGLFSRRRAALEQQDRLNAQILAEKKHLGIPDKQLRTVSDIKPGINTNSSTEALEKELGILNEELAKNG